MSGPIKLSALPPDSSPSISDYVVGVQSAGTVDVLFPLSALASLIAANLAQSSSNPYKFRVYRNAGFNATSTLTTIIPDSVVFDSSSSVSLSTGLYTAPIDGFYMFGGRSGIAVASGNEILCSLAKSGSASEVLDGNRGISTDTQSGLIASNVMAPFQLVASDTVGLQIFSNSTVAAQAGPETTYFWGYLISAF